MKRSKSVTGWILALLLLGYIAGHATAQTSGTGLIQLDDDYTWHYINVPQTPTPEEFTPTPGPTETPTPTSTPLTVCTGTTTSALNVRSGPGTNYPNLQNSDGSKLVYQSSFTFAIMGYAYGEKGDLWLKTAVKVQTGYVSAAYVTVSGDCSGVMPTATPF